MLQFARRLYGHILLVLREFALNALRHRFFVALNYLAMRFWTPFGVLRPNLSRLPGDNPTAVALRVDGTASLQPFGAADVAALIAHFCDKVDAGIGHRYASLPDYFEHYRQRKIQRPPGIFATGRPDCPMTRLIRDDHLVEIAAQYLGIEKTALLCQSNMDALIRLDAPARSATGYDDALEFHRDIDSYRFVKMFVYLTDCFEGDGHHEYFVGSHLKTPLRLGPIARYANREIEAAIPGLALRIIQGEAGFAFAEDTFGFHRGTKPTSNNRLIFNIEYLDHAFGALYPEAFPVVPDKAEPQHALTGAKSAIGAAVR